MFFQDASTPGGQSEKVDPLASFDINKSRQLLDQYSNQIIGTFTQGRERVFEFQRSIMDALPNIRRLGGDIGSTSKVIDEVAQASRRNVIANQEDVEKLYAASKVLGVSAKDLTDGFLNVGMGLEHISETLEESVEYVQSIGGNARQVMQDVSKNMDQMNRFQFDNGVLGLTKMAAQASMLRFDMGKTFAFADKLLSPEAAIEAASSFQRLGLAVGSLGDPLQLLSQSLNDPSGIQDSLIEISKQFTYFDDKTKSFKVSQDGILRFRELAETTGISAAEMAKLGVSAAELDQRLSAVDAAGLKIATEEDKQYLANILKLKDGVYTVTLEDGRPQQLADLQQDEFNKLIDAQKNGPKTLEDYARAQLGIDEIVKNDIAAIKYALTGGLLTDKNIQQLTEQARTASDAFLRGAGEKVTTKDVREKSEELTTKMAGAIEELKGKIAKGDINPEEIADSIGAIAMSKFGDLTESTKELINKASESIKEKLRESGGEIPNLDETLRNLSRNMFKTEASTTEQGTTKYQTIPIVPNSSSPLGTTQPQNQGNPTNLNLDGEIDVNVNFDNFPIGLSIQQKDELSMILKDKFASQEFENIIKEISKKDA